MAELTDLEKRVLDFAGREYRLAGVQEEAIRHEFGTTGTRYWQRLNTLLSRPEAMDYAPHTVNRYRRIRADRLRRRSLRANGIGPPRRGY